MQKNYYPIVYIRGYASSQSEVEDTVADPYMGFNLGSTKQRQLHSGNIDKIIFESPLIRLMKDYGYKDVYKDGQIMPNIEDNPSNKTVWIFRYYNQASKDLGTGHRPEMEKYAEDLYSYLKNVRKLICKNDSEKLANFKVYLVAHSMGGLVARTYLQNIKRNYNDAVEVDKVFTYGTPHGGIDFRLIGNIPTFMRMNNQENFNTKRMYEYLKISNTEPVNSLNGYFPPERFFSFMGSAYKDYAVAYGLSSMAVGPMSDGLVKLENAYVKNSPRAVANRAHSGHYGIVNSESGYQNLVRFLFGDYRVVGELIVSSLELPPKVQKKKDSGKKIRASYHFDVITGVKKLHTHLHRRIRDESSALFKSYDRIVKSKDKPIKLFSMFLSKKYRASKSKNIVYMLELKVYIPEYEIDNKYWFDDYIEGDTIFSKLLEIELSDTDEPFIKYTWKDEPKRISRNISQNQSSFIFEIPVKSKSKPKLDATLRLNIDKWN